MTKVAQAQSQSYATAVTTTTAASIDSTQLEQAQRMREAGIITQKEYDRILANKKTVLDYNEVE